MDFLSFKYFADLAKIARWKYCSEVKGYAENDMLAKEFCRGDTKLIDYFKYYKYCFDPVVKKGVIFASTDLRPNEYSTVAKYYPSTKERVYN